MIRVIVRPILISPCLWGVSTGGNDGGRSVLLSKGHSPRVVEDLQAAVNALQVLLALGFEFAHQLDEGTVDLVALSVLRCVNEAIGVVDQVLPVDDQFPKGDGRVQWVGFGCVMSRHLSRR